MKSVPSSFLTSFRNILLSVPFGDGETPRLEAKLSLRNGRLISPVSSFQIKTEPTMSMERRHQNCHTGESRYPGFFIHLRRRPRALPVDEAQALAKLLRCSKLMLRRISLLVDNPPKPWRRRVFKWRYHGLCPWGSIPID